MSTLESNSKFSLVSSGELQVSHVSPHKRVIGKVFGSINRRWEKHTVVLTDTQLYSQEKYGIFSMPIFLDLIQHIDVVTVSTWEPAINSAVQLRFTDGIVLLQANGPYERDQWFHSLLWKFSVLNHKKSLKMTSCPEIIAKELKSLVKIALKSQLHDPQVWTDCLVLISNQLNHTNSLPPNALEEIIEALGPALIQLNPPTPELCDFFSRYCRDGPCAATAVVVFAPGVHSILKHNVDFGKYTYIRTFARDFIIALASQDACPESLPCFVHTMHSPGARCPHPRVLPNLMAVFLAAIWSAFDTKCSYRRNSSVNLLLGSNRTEITNNKLPKEKVTSCFMKMIELCATHEDWVKEMAPLLHPIPFPEEALKFPPFVMGMVSVLKRFAGDQRPEVRECLFPMREGKESWIQLIAPDHNCCPDDGKTFCDIVRTLLERAPVRRKLVRQLAHSCLDAFRLMVIRGDDFFVRMLSEMLESDVIEDKEQKEQVLSTLCSNTDGARLYRAMCDRQAALCNLAQLGGPTKLTMPAHSTDTDVEKVLSSGPFGNLEKLSLAFTCVTSDCARHLVKLPNLQHLNLWCTQFGDTGLCLLAEHCHRLKSLNLCETLVTDEGLLALTELKTLTCLNLNSTKLSAQVFEELVNKLPSLASYDIRYTEACQNKDGTYIREGKPVQNGASKSLQAEMFDNRKGVVDGPFLKYSPVPDRKHDEGDKDEQDEEVPDNDAMSQSHHSQWNGKNIPTFTLNNNGMMSEQSTLLTTRRQSTPAAFLSATREFLFRDLGSNRKMGNKSAQKAAGDSKQ